MLDVYINGRKIETLLDTGSPISTMPVKLTKWLQPIKRLNLPMGKRFVDINQNPIKMAARFETTAKLGKTCGQTVWWEAEEIDIPILGMDNFKKLKLSVRQKKPNSNEKDQENKKMEKICFIEREIEDPQQHYSTKIAETFKKLFETNLEVE